MRLPFLALLGSLAAVPAMAQTYYVSPAYGYPAPPAYGYVAPAPGSWEAARSEWHRAHRAEEIAHWRAYSGDYEGAARAEYWADRHRERAQWNAAAARGGW